MYPLDGIEIVQNINIEPGTAYHMGSRVFMHPLDVIWLGYQKDPLGRLDAAMAWILRNTNGRLDDLAFKITIGDFPRKGVSQS